MTTPTKDELDRARAWFLDGGVNSPMHDHDPNIKHIRVLLAATEEPSEEELAEEAMALAIKRKNKSPTRIAQFIPAYIAGARREGRR